jgi:hypothetical protein
MNVIAQNLKPEFAQVLHKALVNQYGNIFVVQVFQANPKRMDIALSKDTAIHTPASAVDRMVSFAAGFAVGWADGAGAVQLMLLREAGRG